MVKGLDTFQKYFADYEEQYVLIGGAACDILFESNEVNFRATRDFGSLSLMENIETKRQTVAILNFIDLISQKTITFRK